MKTRVLTAVTVRVRMKRAGFQIVESRVRNPIIIEGRRTPLRRSPEPCRRPMRKDTKFSLDSIPSSLIS